MHLDLISGQNHEVADKARRQNPKGPLGCYLERTYGRAACSASRCEAAHMRVGHAQIFVWIHRNVVDPHFIVKMGPGATSAIADVADGVSAMDVLAREYCEALEMSVACGDAVTVVEDDGASVAAHEIGELNHGFGRSNDRLTVQGSDVDARVKCAFTIKWINALTE